jgi:hypothetical protein
MATESTALKHASSKVLITAKSNQDIRVEKTRLFKKEENQDLG